MTALETPPQGGRADPVIDLRHPGTPNVAFATSVDDTPSGPRRKRRSIGYRIGRVTVLVVLALVGIVVIDIVLGSVAHTERQRHLADEFSEREGAADLRSGDASAVIQAPDIGLNQVVIEDATAAHLRGGPARRLDSAVPGEGNTVVMARSSRFSGPFDRLDELAEGAVVALQTRDGGVVEYSVTSVEKVDASDVDLSDDGDTRLTLVTSNGGPLSDSRLVVVAEPVGAAEGEPVEGEAAESSEGESSAGQELGVDLRGNSLLVMLAGLVLMAIGALATWKLRGRYSPLTIAVVGGPVAAVGLALFLFHLDGLLATTY